MKYPSYEEYNFRYKNYLKRDPSELFKNITFDKKVLLDLCGGNGRLSIYAKNQGADVTYLDQELDMTPFELLKGVSILHMSVEEFFASSSIKFDIIACQQGINYWFDPKIIESIYYGLNYDGVFIFNTFNKKPSEIKKTKIYSIDGKEYKETNILIDNIVYHTQECEGIIHTTEFKWISPETFNSILIEYFDLSIFIDGPTSIYHCRRK